MNEFDIHKHFYAQPTQIVPEQLVGCKLTYLTKSGLISGIINETEAYTQEDPASHSYMGRITKRNAVMFQEPGTIYVYMIYGMYFCFNIVTEKLGRGCAVLIRSIIPIEGINILLKNRSVLKQSELCNGPGKIMMALNLNASINDQSIIGHPSLSINLNRIAPLDLKKTSRIGISKGTDLLWRFKANKFESHLQ